MRLLMVMQSTSGGTKTLEDSIIGIGASWHPSIERHLQSLMKAARDGQPADIDTVLTMVTKEVESQFRKLLEGKTGLKFEKQAGCDLVAVAVKHKIIKIRFFQGFGIKF